MVVSPTETPPSADPAVHWPERSQGEPSSERRLIRRILLLTTPLFVAMILAFPNIGPLFRTFNSPSTSMAPTFPIGSFHMVSRVSYGYSRTSFDWFDLPITGRWPLWLPKRGDIAVFRTPKDLSTFYIKRIIGLPGDRVQMIKGRLTINGSTMKREPAKANVRHPLDRAAEALTFVETLPEGVFYSIIETEGDAGGYDDTQEFLVPEGHYFLLGDNRDNSNDSRSEATVGYVPLDLLLGRVIFTIPGATGEADDQ